MKGGGDYQISDFLLPNSCVQFTLSSSFESDLGLLVETKGNDADPWKGFLRAVFKSQLMHLFLAELSKYRKVRM
jgi:hypothetical protein